MSKTSEGMHPAQLPIMEPIDPERLKKAYIRKPGDPIVSSDRLFLDQNPDDEGAEVVAFKWKGPSDPSMDDDYLQVKTGGCLQDLAYLSAKQCSRNQVGVRPPLRLNTSKVKEVGKGARSCFDEFLKTPLVSSGGQRLSALDILRTLSKTGYDKIEKACKLKISRIFGQRFRGKNGLK